MDPSKSQWSAVNALQPPSGVKELNGHSATLVGGEIIIFGGLSVKRHAFVGLSLLDYRWRQICVVGPFPKTRSFHSMTLAKDKLVLLGGKNESGTFNRVGLYDLIEQHYEEFSPPEKFSRAFKRWQHSAVYFQQLNEIVVFGGRDGAVKALTLFALNTESWGIRQIKPKGRRPPPVGMQTASVHRYNMFVLLGTNILVDNRLFVLNMQPGRLEEWTEVKCKGAVPTGLTTFSSVLYHNSLIVFGGYSYMDKQYCNDLSVLDLANLTWSIANSKTVEGEHARRWPKRITKSVGIPMNDQILWVGGTKLKHLISLSFPK